MDGERKGNISKEEAKGALDGEERGNMFQSFCGCGLNSARAWCACLFVVSVYHLFTTLRFLIFSSKRAE